jgi:glycosyltransferase involved in cell wall biosynthesis
MMKILLVNNHLPQSGIGRYAYSLFPALKRELGEDVDLFDCSTKSLDNIFYKNHPKRLLILAGDSVRTVSLIQSMLRIPRASLYHFLNPMLSALNPLVYPRIVTLHDVKIPVVNKRLISDYVIAALLRSLKTADLVISVSSFTARVVQNRLGLDPKRIVVIPLGIDHQRFRYRDKLSARRLLGFREDAKIILHVGSDEERKNIPGLYRIFRMVRRRVPGAVLLRVGVTNETFPPEDLAKDVRLVEPIDEILPYYYNASDLFVFPSLLEGFGIPLVEAMASGTPIVTSGTTSIPEVVGDSALAFDPRDEVSMVDSSVQLLTDGGYAMELAQRGLERSKSFSWEVCAARTQEAYSRVLGT